MLSYKSWLKTLSSYKHRCTYFIVQTPVKKPKAIIKAVVEIIVNTQSVENNAIIQTVVEINTIIQAVMENIDIIQAVLENKAIIHSMLDRHHTSSGEKTPLYKQWWKYIQAMMENSAIMQAVVEIIAVIQAMV